MTTYVYDRVETKAMLHPVIRRYANYEVPTRHTIEHTDLPKLAKSIGCKVDELQACLEGRSNELVAKDGSRYRSVPYVYRRPPEHVDIEDPKFIAEIARYNESIKNGEGVRPATLEGWQEGTRWKQE